MRIATALLLLSGCAAQHVPGPVSLPEVRDQYVAEWGAARWEELGLPPIGDCPVPEIWWPSSDDTREHWCCRDQSPCGVEACLAQYKAGWQDQRSVIVIGHRFPRWYWVHELLHAYERCAGVKGPYHSNVLIWGPDAPADWGGLLRELEDKAQEVSHGTR